MKLKRYLSIAVAFVLLCVCISITPLQAADNFSLALEGEDATLDGGVQATDKVYNDQYPEFSGTGFAWMQGSGTIKFNVTVPEKGAYKIVARSYGYLTDDRLQNIYVNNVNKGKYTFPATTAWTDVNLGLFPFNKGENTFEIRAEYGYLLVDKITVTNSPYSFDLSTPLVDRKATPEAVALNKYLQSVYGKHTLTGQQEIYGGGHDGNYDYEMDWVYDLTGDYPALRGIEFMNYNPLYGWDDGTTERAIEWDKNGGILTAVWHICVPKQWDSYVLGEEVDWQQATYKPDSTFNVNKASEKGTKEYDYFQLCIEDLAEQLLILQDAGVPIIWRPFHECAGNGNDAYFWWGGAGAEAYKKLWVLLYKELTETYEIHNLIWNFNFDYYSNDAWYPGDEYVDIISMDKYNTQYNRFDGKSGPNEDAISAKFYSLVDLGKGQKMVAMSENDTVPSLENMLAEEAYWLFTMPWYDNDPKFLTSPDKNNPDTLKTLYQSDYALMLSEIKGWKENFMSEIPVTTTSSTTSSIITSSDPDSTDLCGDVNLDGKIGIADLILLAKRLSFKVNLTPQQEKNARTTSDSAINAECLLALIKFLAGEVKNLPI